LTELKVFGDPVVSRKYEDGHRNEYVASLKKVIVQFQMFAQSTEEKYAHIDAEERKKVLTEAASADQYLVENLGKQDKVSKWDNPAVTCEQLRQRQTALESVCAPVINKPKPVPKKEEPKPDKPETKPETKPEAKPESKADAESAPPKPQKEEEKPKEKEPKAKQTKTKEKGDKDTDKDPKGGAPMDTNP